MTGKTAKIWYADVCLKNITTISIIAQTYQRDPRTITDSGTYDTL